MSAQTSLFDRVERQVISVELRRVMDRMDAQIGRMTPAEHGDAGAADARKHLVDHAPGWVLERLGDALVSLRGREFTSDDVRRIAGPTVDAWLVAEPVRVNTFSGWFQKATRRHHLQRVGSKPSNRENGRGRWVGVWRFPE